MDESWCDYQHLGVQNRLHCYFDLYDRSERLRQNRIGKPLSWKVVLQKSWASEAVGEAFAKARLWVSLIALWRELEYI